jgi:predicted TIM-barrel fold metal-dependent hydrolase
MGGIAGFLEAVMLTTRTPNAYVDCSPGQGLWALEAAGPIVGTIPPEKLLWGADTYDYAGLIPRYRAALAAAGFGEHFEKVFYANARGLLERIGAIPRRP